MKNLVITGYSGFIGSHLSEALKDKYLLKLVGRKHSSLGEFFKCDLSMDDNYEVIFQNVSCVIHVAAQTQTIRDDFNDYKMINIYGTLNLAKHAAKAGVKRFIFISTIKVNGESTTNRAPFSINDLPNPMDPYGISKAEAEQRLLKLGEQTGMQIVIIRPPLVYGDGVKANFASLMKLVGKGLPLPFRLINQNKRSLVSVYNLVDLIKVCIEHPKAANQIFLVSDDHDVSTAQMVALMAKVQGKKNLSLPVPVWCFKLAGKLLNKNDVIDRLIGSLQLDLTHTKNTLDWKPPHSIEHGFKLTAKNLR